MGRLARFIPPDSYFHILSRGNNRQNVFLNDENFEKFLEFLKVFAEKFVWKVTHYVLMNNHYHIILFNTVPENLSNGIKLLNQS